MDESMDWDIYRLWALYYCAGCEQFIIEAFKNGVILPVRVNGCNLFSSVEHNLKYSQITDLLSKLGRKNKEGNNKLELWKFSNASRKKILNSIDESR